MTIRKMISALFVLLLTPNSLYSSQFPLPNLDEDIQNTMKDFNVPGMAVGIVENDTVFYQKGFGVRNVISKEPIDTNTIFGIGSTTKTFTSGLAAILVDEGVIDWDDKVIASVPVGQRAHRGEWRRAAALDVQTELAEQLERLRDEGHVALYASDTPHIPQGFLSQSFTPISSAINSFPKTSLPSKALPQRSLFGSGVPEPMMVRRMGNSN